MLSLFACRHTIRLFIPTQTWNIRQGVRKQIEFDVLSVCVWRFFSSLFFSLSSHCFNFGLSRHLFVRLRSVFFSLVFHFYSQFCHLSPIRTLGTYCFGESHNSFNIAVMWIIDGDANNIISLVCMSIRREIPFILSNRHIWINEPDTHAYIGIHALTLSSKQASIHARTHSRKSNSQQATSTPNKF